MHVFHPSGMQKAVFHRAESLHRFSVKNGAEMPEKCKDIAKSLIFILWIFIFGTPFSGFSEVFFARSASGFRQISSTLPPPSPRFFPTVSQHCRIRFPPHSAIHFHIGWRGCWASLEKHRNFAMESAEVLMGKCGGFPAKLPHFSPRLPRW